MTLPLTPAPRLSEEAQPYVRAELPEPPPDLDAAYRAFSGTRVRGEELGQRDLRERELLGMAMGSKSGLAALRELRPEEFAIPVNQNVAKAVLDLANDGRACDAAAVTAELRERPLLNTFPPPDDRPARESRFLLAAMDGRPELARLIRTDDSVFSPAARPVAQAIRDLAVTDQPTDRLSVQAELDRRGEIASIPVYEAAAPCNSQLPPELDPTVGPGSDPRVKGLGAWQTIGWAPSVRAPVLAREIRSLYRQDKLQEIARRSLGRARDGLEFGPTGRLETDHLAEVTKQLADELVSIPPELTPERSISNAWDFPTSSERPGDLGLPRIPSLSRRGAELIRR